MEYTKKLVYQSNYWYNDGLRKANIQDMSGAIASLRKSLQYNRENIAARNLLGLVYYGCGEVVEALVEWVISKNLKTHENIANYYIKKIQESPTEFEAINQAVKKFNQCLVYCHQGGEDLAVIQLKKVVLAHPTYLKAYQLLGLLYIQTEQYAKARQILRKAHKLDTTNVITLSYMHELNQLHNKKVAKLKENREETVTYNLGNETIIQPVSATLKDNAGILTIINILIGVALGAALVWFLVVPATSGSQAAKNNKEALEYSEQLEAKNAENNALKKELDEYRASSEVAEAEKANAELAQQSYEALMTVVEQDNAGNYSDATMAETLKTVNRESLGEGGKGIYDQLADSIFTNVCQKLYRTASQNYNAENYQGAVDSLEEIMTMNEGYLEGDALLLLADAYASLEDVDKANEKYNRIMELYPDTQVAADAEKGLSGTIKGTGSGNTSRGDEDED